MVHWATFPVVVCIARSGETTRHCPRPETLHNFHWSDGVSPFCYRSDDAPRRLVVACVLHTTTAKQADTLLAAGGPVRRPPYSAHWTVKKAGGTALAGLARRIACAKNPQIKDLNPCCIQDFCADHRARARWTCLVVRAVRR